MPYFTDAEPGFDKHGRRIALGDLLEMDTEGTDLQPWQYHICVESHDGGYCVRDLNAWNVCICDIGHGKAGGNVTNLGNWRENRDKLDEHEVRMLEDEFDLTREESK
jgi:hypothetical protein